MLLSAPRGKSEEKQQTAFFGSTRATPQTCAVAPYRSKAFAAERVPRGCRLERVEIELNSRILAQLMLHPVPGVGPGRLVRVFAPRVLDHLLVGASEGSAGKLVHGFGNPILAVGVIHPI